jgi:hypothetical protein
MKLTFLSALLALLCLGMAPAAHAERLVLRRPHHHVYHHRHIHHHWHHRWHRPAHHYYH